jgi:EAL and modified HD-GYP domain-containing signal transduction protein
MDVFVARQPIFDARKNVIAYELLFRSGIDNFYDPQTDGDQATYKVVLNSFFVIGMHTLTKGKRAFINFSRNLIVRGAPSMMPRELIGVEILETVEADDEIIAACRELKAAGYVVALDDFVLHERYFPLLKLADIIKVDFLATPTENRKAIVQQCKSHTTHSIQFLAEKVETREDFEEGLDLGYVYFQGYFFSRPDVVSGKDIPGSKLTCLRMINEVNKPEASIDDVDQVIRRDVSLSYKLLQFVNSAFFGLTVQIQSIRHALMMLGLREIKKWASLVALYNLGYDKPQELLTLSLIRARVCEMLGLKINMQARSADLFLMGLFSLIDALVDRPMEELMRDLPVAEDLKQALLGEENRLNDVYRLVISYEKGEWDTTAAYLDKLGLDEAVLPDIYLQSVTWANTAI